MKKCKRIGSKSCTLGTKATVKIETSCSQPESFSKVKLDVNCKITFIKFFYFIGKKKIFVTKETRCLFSKYKYSYFGTRKEENLLSNDFKLKALDIEISINVYFCSCSSELLKISAVKKTQLSSQQTKIMS